MNAFRRAIRDRARRWFQTTAPYAAHYDEGNFLTWWRARLDEALTWCRNAGRDALYRWNAGPAIPDRHRCGDLFSYGIPGGESGFPLPVGTTIPTVDLPQLGGVPRMVSPAPIQNFADSEGAPRSITPPTTMPTLLPVLSGGLAGLSHDEAPRTTFGVITDVVTGALGGLLGKTPGTAMGPPSLPPTMQAGMAMLGGPMAAGMGVMVTAVRAILLKASMFVGKRVSFATVRALITKFGPTIAATALGISLGELLTLWTHGAGKPRRRRGISAADLRRTTSTLRKVASINAQVGAWCGRGAGRRAIRRKARR